GYPQYAPATFVIKALMAVCFCFVVKAFSGRQSFAAKIIGGVAAEAIMVIGYFGYEAVILKYGIGAAGSISGNVIQGAVGIAAATALCTATQAAFTKSKILSSILK
ncbi:MAG: ECF transporter S component, partial [Clostridia bacterium]|nr:ECF transporter S component [Clostridia bacterium]